MSKRRMIVGLLVSMLGLGSVVADTYKIVGVATGDTLNVRQQPGMSGKVLYKLPTNATEVSATGKTAQVGKTVWAEIKYQNKVGWVNQRYIAADKAKTTTKTSNKTEKTAVAKVEQKPEAKAKEKEVVSRAPAPKPSGSWVLVCGNTAPFWKAEILPKSINLYQGNDYAVNVPITYKNQEHGAKNVAAVTVVKGSRGKDQVNLTIKYSGQCRSSLAKRRVSFRVSGKMNGEKIGGCCYSYPVR
ncbi:SH3 domain-containing protein [Thiofilum flexile]|uniref:SH3 domain-containing protein n=1 Tax=Thiofilum flexile TaxID=125627 RepID=UPI00037338B2|nr:SH3 domain-containing protein [Thiofilum flexile]